MVLFSGLWKANHRYNDETDEEDRTTSNNHYRQHNNHKQRKPLNIKTSPRGKRKNSEFEQDQQTQSQQQLPEENTIDQINKEEEETTRPQSQASLSSSSRQSRGVRIPRSNYVTSVLFGGLWARSDARRRRQSDDGLSCSEIQHYGAVSFENHNQHDDIEDNHDHDSNNASNHNGTDNNDHDDDNDDGDDGSNFPSLTSVFNPDEIDWSVLRICLLYLSAYALVAIIAYCYVFEHWTVIDALYFAVCTFTTVGYGDLQPTTALGQIFTIAFAVYGVIVLGIFIGIFGHAISEGQAHTVRKLKTGRQRKLIKLLFRSTRKLEAARDIRRERLLQEHGSLMDDIGHVIKAEMLSILLVIVLAFVLGVREGWSITSTAYFAIMSASTTGYGDYTPATQIDKLYCIFFLPISVAVFGEVLGRIASVYITRRTRQAEQNFLRRNMTKFDLRQMDENDDGMVSMEEWLTFMLVSLQKVDAGFLEDLKSIFYELDTNGNGFVDKDDLVGIHKTPQWRQIQAIAKQD